MKKEVEVLEKKTKTQYICDICNKEFSKSYWEGHCYVCKKDICRDCAIVSDYITRIAVDSDCPGIYCKLCWVNGKQFREDLDQLTSKFEADKKELYSKWKTMSNRK